MLHLLARAPRVPRAAALRPVRALSSRSAAAAASAARFSGSSALACAASAPATAAGRRAALLLPLPRSTRGFASKPVDSAAGAEAEAEADAEEDADEDDAEEGADAADAPPAKLTAEMYREADHAEPDSAPRRPRLPNRDEQADALLRGEYDPEHESHAFQAEMDDLEDEVYDIEGTPAQRAAAREERRDLEFDENSPAEEGRDQEMLEDLDDKWGGTHPDDMDEGFVEGDADYKVVDGRRVFLRTVRQKDGSEQKTYLDRTGRPWRKQLDYEEQTNGEEEEFASVMQTRHAHAKRHARRRHRPRRGEQVGVASLRPLPSSHLAPAVPCAVVFLQWLRGSDQVQGRRSGRGDVGQEEAEGGRGRRRRRGAAAGSAVQ